MQPFMVHTRLSSLLDSNVPVIVTSPAALTLKFVLSTISVFPLNVTVPAEIVQLLVSSANLLRTSPSRTITAEISLYDVLSDV